MSARHRRWQERSPSPGLSLIHIYRLKSQRRGYAALNDFHSLLPVSYTHLIGQQIPIEKIKEGVKAMVPILEHSSQAGGLAAEAIMTTDTVKKEVAATVELGGKNVTIGGMCKGSGMIHPNMCTMLKMCIRDRITTWTQTFSRTRSAAIMTKRPIRRVKNTFWCCLMMKWCI